MSQALVRGSRLFGLRAPGAARAAMTASRAPGCRTGSAQVLVPTEEVVEMRAGQKRKSERKFFPGYVLVQIETDDEGGIPRIDNESWHLIKETPKVMGFIGGTAERPLPIKDSEADVILRACRTASTSRKPKVLFEPGEMVRVMRWPVQRLQRHGRGSQLREEPPARGGADFRPFDPGRARVRPGGKGLTTRRRSSGIARIQQ